MENSNYANKRILITGGAGYLGSALAREINRLGGKAIKVSSRIIPSDIESINLQGDIESADFWLNILPNIDTIFHFASNTSVSYAESYPLECLISTLHPINHLISAACILKKKPKVIFSSTATIYGLTPNIPVSESVTPQPITNYDLFKLYAEEKLMLANRLGIIDGVSVRLSNVYGPSPSMNQVDGRGILNKSVKLALELKKLYLYGRGEFIRDYIFIDDATRAFLALESSQAVTGSIVNVGSGIGVTLYTAFKLIADSIHEISGETVELKFVKWPSDSQPIDHRNYVANINLINNSCGWAPKITMRDGINTLLNYYTLRM